MKREDVKIQAEEINRLCDNWKERLLGLPEKLISERRNSQHRNIRMITGHLADSASNNIHRIVHLQYQDSPLKFPDYAHRGNNDRWIAIQNFEKEEWHDLVNYCLYSWKHLAHVIRNVDTERARAYWIDAEGTHISLKDMIDSLLPHFRLHLSEIAALQDQLTMDLES